MIIETDMLIKYILFCAVLTASLGPSSLFVTSVSLQYGFRRSVFTIMGEVTGWIVYLFPLIFGLGSFLQASAGLLMYIKYIGGVYLVYLAYHAYTSKGGNGLSKIDQKEITSLVLYRKGFFVSVSNPKVIIYYMAFLPQFIVPNGREMFQLIILGSVDLVIGSFIYSFYAYGADKIKGQLSGNFQEKYLPKITSLIYVLVAMLVIE